MSRIWCALSSRCSTCTIHPFFSDKKCKCSRCLSVVVKVQTLFVHHRHIANEKKKIVKKSWTYSLCLWLPWYFLRETVPVVHLTWDRVCTPSDIQKLNIKSFRSLSELWMIPSPTNTHVRAASVKQRRMHLKKKWLKSIKYHECNSGALNCSLFSGNMCRPTATEEQIIFVVA